MNSLITKFRPKVRKQKGHLEDDLQMQCIQWFDLVYKDKLIFHIPNGGKRDLFEAIRFKKMGVRAGIPDLFLAEATHFSNGLFVELKAGNGKPNDNQKLMASFLNRKGFTVVTCNSFEEFRASIEEYLGSQSKTKDVQLPKTFKVGGTD